MEIHIMKKNTTTINIQNEANINAMGEHTGKNAKPVICLDNGQVFTSMIDAATYANVATSSMVFHLQGKSKACKGKHFCYLSRVNENLDTLVTRLRKTSNDSEDAKKWREYQAEQERIRLEKEAHDALVAKVQDKVNKRKAICERIKAELERADARRIEAEAELNALLNNN